MAVEWAWGLPLAASQVAGSRNALQGCTRSVRFVSWGSSDQIVWKNEMGEVLGENSLLQERARAGLVGEAGGEAAGRQA